MAVGDCTISGAYTYSASGLLSAAEFVTGLSLSTAALTAINPNCNEFYLVALETSAN